jgi:hypothetical protein
LPALGNPGKSTAILGGGVTRLRPDDDFFLLVLWAAFSGDAGGGCDDCGRIYLVFSMGRWTMVLPFP